MVPYVPHALLTQLWGRSSAQGNGQQQLASTAGHALTKSRRAVPFYFRGGVLHGVDCKKNGGCGQNLTLKLRRTGY